MNNHLHLPGSVRDCPTSTSLKLTIVLSYADVLQLKIGIRFEKAYLILRGGSGVLPM